MIHCSVGHGLPSVPARGRFMGGLQLRALLKISNTVLFVPVVCGAAALALVWGLHLQRKSPELLQNLGQVTSLPSW